MLNVNTDQNQLYRHMHPGNNVACFRERCQQREDELMNLLDLEETMEIEINTQLERIAALEASRQRIKAFVNELAAYCSSLEKRIEKLESK
jgi:predicted nuclease with TOPRIM domain